MYLTKQQAAQVEDRGFAHIDAAHELALETRLYGPFDARIVVDHAEHDALIDRAHQLWWLADNLSDAHRATNTYEC